MPKNTSNVLIT